MPLHNTNTKCFLTSWISPTGLYNGAKLSIRAIMSRPVLNTAIVHIFWPAFFRHDLIKEEVKFCIYAILLPILTLSSSIYSEIRCLHWYFPQTHHVVWKCSHLDHDFRQRCLCCGHKHNYGGWFYLQACQLQWVPRLPVSFPLQHIYIFYLFTTYTPSLPINLMTHLPPRSLSSAVVLLTPQTLCYNFFPLSRLFPHLHSTTPLLLLCSLLPRDRSIPTCFPILFLSSCTSSLVLPCSTGLSHSLVTSLMVTTFPGNP